MITSSVLTELKVPHFIIVEPFEVEKYKQAVIQRKLLATILELDLKFKESYELCDSLGMSKSTGPGPARNFAWDHSIKNNYDFHWVMDDNITAFRRFNQNEKVKVSDGAIFKAMEDFCLRYTNIAMAGPNYYMFVPSRQKAKPFVTNTRIYSCNFIRNSVTYRWRGRYNEDTIISLDMLKNGWATVQFNAFLQQKMPTQTIGGGNSQDFYWKEGKKNTNLKYAVGGTIEKSKMLVEVHPDVSSIVWKFNRWHHYVDYSQFKKTKLILRNDYIPKLGKDEYGMKLKHAGEFPSSANN